MRIMCPVCKGYYYHTCLNTLWNEGVWVGGEFLMSPVGSGSDYRSLGQAKSIVTKAYNRCYLCLRRGLLHVPQLFAECFICFLA